MFPTGHLDTLVILAVLSLTSRLQDKVKNYGKQLKWLKFWMTQFQVM